MTESLVSDASQAEPSTARSRRPVFVAGCHRSGTNLLYDTLLSAGGFAIYRGYLPVHKMLIPRFGDPSNPANRKHLVDVFLRSKGFARTGLDAAELSAKLMDQSATGGNFLRTVMGEIAARQGVDRWAVYDPDSLLHIPRIRRDLPDALFIHIVRDGRDVALSLAKMGGFRPFPWNRKPRGLLETALYWQWMTQTGRRHGTLIPGDYIEIHYEDLVQRPRDVLASLSRFLDHDLDYERIRGASLGRLSESNSSFLEEGANSIQPVDRWKQRLTEKEVRSLESLIGTTLEAFGYPLASAAEQRRKTLRMRFLSTAYPQFLDAKLWLKLNTPLGRFADLSALELSTPADDVNSPPQEES